MSKTKKIVNVLAKALEKEQEPMIAAGIAASKASAEAYAIAFKGLGGAHRA